AIFDGNRVAHVIDVRANDVTIEGLIIEKSGVSDVYEFAGIHAEEVTGCQFRSNVLRDVTYGIYLAKTEHCVVEKNISNGNAKDEILGGNGIHLWSSNNNKLIGNTIIRHRDGIYFEFSENLDVKDNRVYFNIRYGLHFMFCDGSHIEDNLFEQNATGVALMYSKNLFLKNNQFTDSRGPSMQGVLLKDITDSHLKENHIYGNTTGAMLDSSSRNKIEGNRFERNGTAFEIYGNSESNTVNGNIFLGNIFDVATNTRENTNNYERNYWDRYQGFDMNRDGLGDVPYSPVQIFSYWMSKYPELSILAGSSMLNFLEIMEKAFPVLTPSTLKDNSPLMKMPQSNTIEPTIQ
ncbi:MAG: nitrous oxide reductase family maturation protein NosD, partial [Leptonema sp. (in: Bacteria)]|nr:nitrous oxide reductase family maturation protein NosD [Leptonema sp. (in: bacteria)]